MTSCKKDQYSESLEFELSDFEQKQHLTSRLIELDSLVFPERILQSAFHDLLFIVDDYGGNLLSIYDLSERKLLHRIIKKGQGPNELLDINGIQLINNHKTLVISSKLQKSSHFYRLQDILTNDNPRPYHSVKLKSDFVSNPQVVHNNQIIDLKWNYQGEEPFRFNVYDRNGSKVDVKGSFPEFSKQVLDRQTYEAYFSLIGLNNYRIVLAHFHTDLLEIYNENLELVTRIHGPDQFFPAITSRKVGDNELVVPAKGSRNGFAGKPILTEEAIYVLYDGKEKTKSGYHQQTLFSFDLNGKPIKHFTLDRPIFGFDIDEQEMILYGISHEEEGMLIQYQL